MPVIAKRWADMHAQAVALPFGALGVLLGGLIADRTRRHDLVIAGGFCIAAGLLVVIGLASLPIAGVILLMTVVGLAQGSVRPSRDMVVRAAAPNDAVGTVFGFVTSGFNVGVALAPVFFGWLIDQGRAELVFVMAAAVMMLALAAAFLAIRAPVPRSRLLLAVAPTPYRLPSSPC